MSSLAAAARRPRESPADLSGLVGFPRKAALGDLLAVAGAALRFWPPLYVQSILGPVNSWRPPHRQLSELGIIDPWRALRTLRFLSDVSVPSLSGRAPALLDALLPAPISGRFFRQTSFFQHPAPAAPSAAGERWFFINGIATNRDVARMNAALLVELFHRPLTVIHNPTNSFGLDLAECAIGKGYRTEPDLADHGTFTEPALRATIALLDSLNDPAVDRVVVIAHSQGTIIAANVLRAIARALGALAGAGRRASAVRAVRRVAAALTVRLAAGSLGLRQRLADTLAAFGERPGRALTRLEKLELYSFANCADKLRWVVERDGLRLPYLENFANRHDLVARLGVLSPWRGRPRRIAIDGPLYLRSGEGGWGHLLNQHHLFAILDHLRLPGEVPNPYPPADPADPPVPRLYGYFRGGRPAAAAAAG